MSVAKVCDGTAYICQTLYKSFNAFILELKMDIKVARKILSKLAGNSDSVKAVEACVTIFKVLDAEALKPSHNKSLPVISNPQNPLYYLEDGSIGIGRKESCSLNYRPREEKKK